MSSIEIKPEPDRFETAPDSAHQPEPTAWSTTDAAELYRVKEWGRGYFSIADQGHLIVRPDPTHDVRVDLMDVVAGLDMRSLELPVVVRFDDLLGCRLHEIHAAFHEAIADHEYDGTYHAVYPIKVNQQRHVVEEVLRRGESLDFGLEVGSKPELLAALGLTAAYPDRPIICNGFKDDRYLEAVILATKLGRRIIPVVESFNEVLLIKKYADKYDVRPQFGVRVKLASQGVGRWALSAGARSKFGLFISEILEMFQYLRAHGMEDCLKLLHCHIGSQIHDIRTIKTAISELSRVYVELVQMGAGLKILDIGGGLGIDYSGCQSNDESSMNYTLREYAGDVVHRIRNACVDAKVDHPDIISESGRAMVAYHSMLLFNVLGTSGFDRFEVPLNDGEVTVDTADAPQPVQDLAYAYQSVTADNVAECYHDASQARDEVVNLFNLGYMSLAERSNAEQLFWGTCTRIRDFCRDLDRVPEELDDIEFVLSDTYFCNFSLFQSLPDSWAVDQMFPVMPIHRLDEAPTRQAILADITCDSDGKIDRFVSGEDSSRTLALHEYDPSQPYYLGAFIVGAYQETLGDLHNLFGDTHVVHICVDPEAGDWWIDEVVEGDTVREVLEYVQYDVNRLHRSVRRDCEQAVRENRMGLEEAQGLLRFYEDGLNSYTYLEEH